MPYCEEGGKGTPFAVSHLRFVGLSLVGLLLREHILELNGSMALNKLGDFSPMLGFGLDRVYYLNQRTGETARALDLRPLALRRLWVKTNGILF